MRLNICLLLLLSLFVSWPAEAQEDPLPFQFKTEVYRGEEDEVVVFALRLEQPFLADEFEQSNYLGLKSADANSYLIYPRRTRFKQRHAEFYGRLRDGEKALLSLDYETVHEALDGTRKVEVRTAEIEVKIPRQETGPRSLYQEWARQQNAHFSSLLDYYLDETVFEYALLQSGKRYGIAPPTLRRPMPTKEEIEYDLYYTFSGGLSVQRSLQRQALKGGSATGELDTHISQLRPPEVRPLPYAGMLKRQEEEGLKPKTPGISRLVPADQYFLHFNSMEAFDGLMEMASDWGEPLLRLCTVRSRRQDLREKFQDQLCLDQSDIANLFQVGVVSELAVTGSDILLAEGTDVTVLLRLRRPDLFHPAARRWLEEVKGRYPAMVQQAFNYRGHQVRASYTSDRMVSSFVVEDGEYIIYSNSHRAIRRMLDTIAGEVENLHDSPDFRYVSTLLPPGETATSSYLFASDAFLRRLASPELKISEKRRLQCFNNLVMLNNASLFHRLEHGRSPESLTDLIEGRFVDPDKLVCPHGGAYAFDAERDTCTCSLHNRLKYLTPNIELNVLKVSARERQEYERYRQRYEQFWRKIFDPLAVRIDAGPRMKIDVAVLPFANSSSYEDLEDWLVDAPSLFATGNIAKTAVVSLSFSPDRDAVREFLGGLPGIVDLLYADPTLTDLSWIGERCGLHFCDGAPVLEIDPTRIREKGISFDVPIIEQAMATAVLTATNLPCYATIDVLDRDKAHRLLRALSSDLALEEWDMFGMDTALDAYRLPDYRDHETYVISYQLYAVKLRLHVAVVGDQLVAATRPDTLREVIDAFAKKNPGDAREAHVMLRLNRRAVNQLLGDLRVYWSEKTRKACHRNVMSIYNLVKLYDTPVSGVDRLSDAKYGVTFFCCDGGEYIYDVDQDQVSCSLHGNRQGPRQDIPPNGESSFAAFIESLDEIVATLRYSEDCLIATFEIERAN